MPISFEYIDIDAVIVSLIASMIFIALWYSQKGFGNIWLKFYHLHKREEDRLLGKAIVVEMIAILTVVFSVNLVLEWAMVQNWLEGVQAGLFVAIGFGVPLLILLYIGYLGKRKPVKFFLINAIAVTIDFAIIGGILGYFWALRH